MSLKIIRCGLDSESADEYMEKMNRPGKTVLIVPDQFSYMAEKRVSSRFGGTGLNNKHVMTFRQMRRQFLNLSDDRYLSQSGKKMLLRMAVNKMTDESSVFYAARNQIGFLDSLESIFTEFKRYCVTPEKLLKSADGKVKALANIYVEYQESLKNGNFLDSEDDFGRIAQELKKNGWFKDSFVVMDCFTYFSPQHMSIIESILLSGAQVLIYLSAKKGGEVSENSLYEYPEMTAQRLIKMCMRIGVSYDEADASHDRIMKPALRAYAQNFETIGYKYSGDAGEIKLFTAKEKYSEVEHMALKIADLVHDDNYRYSDIAVVCGNLDEYISFIEPLFFEYGIPYFSDYKVYMTDHPVAVVIISLFDILENNSWSYDDCMRYLRTGFICTDGEVDIIENHILKRGIRGNMWHKSSYWTTSEGKVFDDITGQRVQESDDTLEHLRNKITEPVMRFKKNTDGVITVREMCTALYVFLDEIQLCEKLEAFVNRLNKTGRENESARFEQVWNQILDVFEQAVTAIGDEQVTRSGFYELFKTGIAGSEISIIPTVSDGVCIASAKRGVTGNVRALFVMGANKGVIPAADINEGILSEADREKLEDEGIELAPGAKIQSIQAEFNTVTMLLAPSEILHISYPISDINGESLEPSQFIFDLTESFCCMDKTDNLVNDSEILYITSPAATIHKLLLKLSDKNGVNPLWDKVRSWYEKDGRWCDKLSLIDTAKNFRSLCAVLLPENAQKLYENYTNYSISRIERYFECPFRYFLENGLNIKEREQWEIGAADTGSLLHWAVCRYCREVDGDSSDIAQKKENWQNLTEDKSKQIIVNIMEEVKNSLKAPEYSARKIDNILGRVEKALLKSVSIINISIKNSKYIGADYEVEFDGKSFSNSDGEIFVKGIIDRVDIYEDSASGNAYIRIIDYKSGKKEYSLERILNNVDLQLVVYAIAAADMYKDKRFDGFSGELNPVVKGVFYDRINNKFVECSYDSSSEAEEKWMQQSKLDGMIFAKEEGSGKTKYLDWEDAQNMDYEIGTVGSSRYLKAAKKVKGDGLDKRKSSAESDEVRDAIIRAVRDGMIDADKKIKNGDVQVSPYRYESAEDSACKYCAYSSICASDREKSPCQGRGRSKKEILEEILGK